MKKILLLLASYLVASFTGSIIGALIWADPFRMTDIGGFMVMAPIFQFVALLQGLGTTSLIGIILLVVFPVVAIASGAFFWKTERKGLLVVFAIPVFIASLPGAGLLCEAIAY